MNNIETLEETIQEVQRLQVTTSRQNAQLAELNQLSQQQLQEARELLGRSQRAVDIALHAYRLDHYGFIWKWDYDSQTYVKTNCRVATPEVPDKSITPEKLADKWASRNQLATFVMILDKKPALNTETPMCECEFLRMVEDMGDLVKALKGSYFFLVLHDGRLYEAEQTEEDGYYKVRCDMDDDYLTISFKVNAEDLLFEEGSLYLYSDCLTQETMVDDITEVEFGVPEQEEDVAGGCECGCGCECESQEPVEP